MKKNNNAIKKVKISAADQNSAILHLLPYKNRQNKILLKKKNPYSSFGLNDF
jgi:hypothetical protein